MQPNRNSFLSLVPDHCEKTMTDFKHDPVVNVIQNQIKKSIRVALDNNCYGAALILLYSGIDMMASLTMPPSQQDVYAKDFVAWVDRYIRFPCEEQLRGDDLYGARCGVLHTYTPYSAKSRKGQSRLIAYADKMVPEVRYQPAINQDLVIVSVEGLVQAFFRGIDECLVNLFSSKETAQIAESRLQELMQTYPVPKNDQS